MDFKESTPEVDFGKILYGGQYDENIENNIKITEKSPEMKVYYPKMTRNTLSVFEYAGVITKLAKYLAGLPSLEKFTDEVEMNQLINPAEMAFKLLDEGKVDAILNRGYELVTFSTLKVKKQWKNMIINYFKGHHESITNEVLKLME